MDPLPDHTGAADCKCSPCALGTRYPVWPQANRLDSSSHPRPASAASAPQSHGRASPGRTYRSPHSRAISEPAAAAWPSHVSLASPQPPLPVRHQSFFGRLFSFLTWHHAKTRVFPQTQETVPRAAGTYGVSFRYPSVPSTVDFPVRDRAAPSTDDASAYPTGATSAPEGGSADEGESYGGPESIADGIYDMVRSRGSATFTAKAELMGKVVFLLLGFTSLIGWNFSLNLAPYMSESLFPEATVNAENSFLAMFQIANLLVQLSLLYVGALRARFIIVGGWSAVIFLSVLTPVVVYLPANIAFICMHIMCFLMGVSSGLLQGAGFLIAGVMPKNFVGAVSVGQGMAGLVAFSLSALLSFAWFPLNARVGVTTTAWAVFLFAALVSVLYSAGVSILMQQPWARHALRRAAKQREQRLELARRRRQEREIAAVAAAAEAMECGLEGDMLEEEGMQTIVDSIPEHGGANQRLTEQQQEQITHESCAADTDARSLWRVALDVAPEMSAVFVTFFITLNIYPLLGPTLLNYNQSFPNHFLILFGVYGIGDLVGRSLPDLSRTAAWLSWLMLPRKYLLLSAFSRALFYIPFLAGYKLKGVPVVNDIWWYAIIMFFLALTHGWTGTLGFIYCGTKIENLGEKDFTGPLTVIALSLGLVAGLYVAYAVY
ncbi:nucleoside transporter protein [Besnoitia besnoiti]|uniref:Nucleoside transporter protein n=1 Tax=Besnoitia besnoiti TaxID=94643 RepID=A0A2A9MQB6_BESBE|nr:nucleoside transporter protein [Besnoitia besnoiti]PFH38413.1 nucleoside transporter protein [Besnoitia besnoiti]